MADLVDVEELMTKWAWLIFETTKNKDQARIPREFLCLTLNWSKVKFHFEQAQYDMMPFSRAEPGPKINVQPQIVFKTHFTNSTSQEQEYSFKTERTTRSEATICVEKGFTAGAEFSLKLSTPCEIAEANAGFKREITVTNIGEDVVEEELTWGVDSQVKVPPHTETTAELVITEAQCTGTFLTRIRFHGRMIANFTNMKDNNSFVTVIEADVADIMLREIERGLKGFKIERRTVVGEMKGKCQFKFGIEQRVRISEGPVKDED